MGVLSFSAVFDRHKGMSAKRKKRPNVAGAGSESQTQQALFAWWSLVHQRFNLPENVLMAIPNGGARNAITGARLRAEGVRAGIPDVFLAAPSGNTHGLFIEVKRPKLPGRAKGQVSASQRAVAEELQAQGYRVVVAYGEQEAINAICDYLGQGA